MSTVYWSILTNSQLTGQLGSQAHTANSNERIDRRDSRIRSVLCQCGVSYRVIAVFLCHAHIIKVLTDLLAAATWPLECAVAGRRPQRIKLSKLKRIKISHTTFIYHSPRPLLKLIKKWYTTF